jgi:hypothetical protein
MYYVSCFLLSCCGKYLSFVIVVYKSCVGTFHMSDIRQMTMKCWPLQQIHVQVVLSFHWLKRVKCWLSNSSVCRKVNHWHSWLTILGLIASILSQENFFPLAISVESPCPQTAVFPFSWQRCSPHEWHPSWDHQRWHGQHIALKY